MPLNLSEDKPKIAKFLAKNQIGMLATADDSGQPYVSTIYFVVDPDLNVYFITKGKTTKYKHLIQNPKAALAVYEAKSQSTVQIYGSAEQILDFPTINDIFRRILVVTNATSESAIPPVSKLVGNDYKCFRIRSRTIRMAEYTKPEHGYKNEEIFDTVVLPDGEL